MKSLIVFIAFSLPMLAIAQISEMNDEFSSPESLSSWQNLQDVEGWPRSQLESAYIDSQGSGSLVMVPYTTTWFNEYKGPLLFKDVSGDFIFTAEVSSSNRAGTGVPSSIFSLAGLMIREPRSIQNGAADWTPQGEDYIFLSLGRTTAFSNTPVGATAAHLEVKNTINSQSRISMQPINIGSEGMQLRIARSGNALICLYRRAEEEWRVVNRYLREDFQQRLQVGVAAYSDYSKAATYSPQFHNSHTLNSDLENDPSANPNLPFNPDVMGRFNYARFSEINLPANLVGVDLTSPQVTDAQLLEFLGDPNANPTPDTFSLSVGSGTGEGIYQAGSQISISANDAPAGQVFSHWSGNSQYIADVNFPDTTIIMPSFNFNLVAIYEDENVSCPSTEIPIQNGVRIMAVGNSFIGNEGGICGFFEAAAASGPIPINVSADCDITYGTLLGEMYDQQLINNANSGNYDLGIFISGSLPAMHQYSTLYQNSCMQPVIMMTWYSETFLSLNPNPIGMGQGVGLDNYRTGMIEIAQNMRAMESQTDALVIPYGLVLYNLTVNPPNSLVSQPLDYLYVDGGNIHDNAFGFWVKTNTMYAVLRGLNPTGLNFNFGPVQDENINTPSTQNIILNETVRTEVQTRVWQIVQGWNAGLPITEIMDIGTDTTPAIQYSLTVNDGQGDGNYTEGSVVGITADTPAAGLVFSQWQGDAGAVSDINDPTTTILMPNVDTTVTAGYGTAPDPNSTHYRYLRTELTEVIGNGVIHLNEIEWLDENGTRLTLPMTSNSSSSVILSTDYIYTNNAYRAFDGNTGSSYYINNNTSPLPVNLTLDFDSQTVVPTAVRITHPMRNDTLNGFRFWASNDGETWQLLTEVTNASVNFINNGAIDEALFNF